MLALLVGKNRFVRERLHGQRIEGYPAV